MALKTIAKFWPQTSKRGVAYFSFTPMADIPSGAKVMLFRRDDDDGSAGSVCIAVDDDEQQPPQQQPRSEENPFEQRRQERLKAAELPDYKADAAAMAERGERPSPF